MRKIDNRRMRVFINYAAEQSMRSQLSVLGNIPGGGIAFIYIVNNSSVTDGNRQWPLQKVVVGCLSSCWNEYKSNIPVTMLNEFNYLSPACRTVDICNEGILCDSVKEVTTQSTETFDGLDVFEW